METGSSSTIDNKRALNIDETAKMAGTKQTFKLIKCTPASMMPMDNRAKPASEAVAQPKPETDELSMPGSHLPISTQGNISTQEADTCTEVSFSKRNLAIHDIVINDAKQRVKAADERPEIMANYESTVAASNDKTVSALDKLKLQLRAADLNKSLNEAKRIDITGRKFKGQWERTYQGTYKRVFHQESRKSVKSNWVLKLGQYKKKSGKSRTSKATKPADKGPGMAVVKRILKEMRA